MSSPPVTLSPLPSPGLEAPASMASSPSRSSKSNPDGRFPYDLSRWNAVDDRVRGGSSVSHLDAVKGGVRFWGTLDTQTLGGAGFASQSYTFLSPLSLPLALYTGLLVELLPRPATDVSSADPLADVEKGHPAKPSKITVVLKIEEPKRRTDGRNEAVTSWEAEFDINDVYASAYAPADTGLYEKPARTPLTSSTNLTAVLSTDQPSLASSSSTSAAPLSPLRPAQARLLWSSFVATYRGRPVEPVPGQPRPRLDSSKIVSMSLMCRSNFAAQEGEFECLIRSIDGIDRAEWSKEAGRKKGLRDMGLRAWLWMILLKMIGR